MIWSQSNTTTIEQQPEKGGCRTSEVWGESSRYEIPLSKER
jgi:hypothetical protein